jgi:curved DNA-binding protein CbpA
MIDLYAVLEVARDATADDIRKAYRRRAMTLHPDHNCGAGSAAAFAELTLARDVLLDPDRRAHYDRTGTVDSGPSLDNTGEALTIIAKMLDEFVIEIIQQQRRMAETNMVSEIRAKLSAKIAELKMQEENLANGQKLWEDTIPRLSRRDRKKPDHLGDLIRGQIRELQHGLDNLQKAIGIYNRALELLSNYDFAVEQPVTIDQFIGWQKGIF